MTLFPPLNERNTRDKAKGLRITSERHIGELSVQCLCTLNRGQDSAATVSNIGMKAKQYEFALKPVLLYTHHQSVAQTPSPYTPIYQPLTTTHLRLREAHSNLAGKVLFLRSKSG